MTTPLEELVDDDPPLVGAASWQPRPWWAWTVGLALLGLVLVGWAGTRLSAGTLGTSLAARACSGSVLAAIGLLGLGALALLGSMQLARLRHPGAQLAWDAGTLAWTLPAPLLLLALTLPGVAGCRAARSLDDLPLVGDAMVGASGILLCGAAAVLLAAALAATASVSWLSPSVAAVDEPIGIVELAIQEAEALAVDESTHRFRNVDDE